MASNITKISTVVVGSIGAMIVATYLFWPTMPTVGKQANDAAMALISATSREDAQALTRIELQIQVWASEEAMPESEQAILNSIIELAESGQWQHANAKARALKMAQVKMPSAD